MNSRDHEGKIAGAAPRADPPASGWPNWRSGWARSAGPCTAHAAPLAERRSKSRPPRLKHTKNLSTPNSGSVRVKRVIQGNYDDILFG
jgi:hypothetical protein